MTSEVLKIKKEFDRGIGKQKLVVVYPPDDLV